MKPTDKAKVSPLGSSNIPNTPQPANATPKDKPTSKPAATAHTCKDEATGSKRADCVPGLYHLAAFVGRRIPSGSDADAPSECLLRTDATAFLDAIPGFPVPLPPNDSPPCFRFASAASKGVFSTRAIRQGEIIVRERPLIVTPEAPVPDCAESLKYNARLMQIAQKSMREDRRKVFAALKDASDGKAIHGVVLPLVPGASQSESYVACCEIMSRCLNSCAPNAAPRFDEASFSFTLYAVRDIAVDEEISIMFLHGKGSKSERTEALKRFGLAGCACSSCTDTTGLSDTRRAAINQYNTSLSSWIVNRHLPSDWFIKRCSVYLDLLEKEGLQADDGYCVGAQVMLGAYVCLGDTQNASKWAAKAEKRMWSIEDELVLAVGATVPGPE